MVISSEARNLRLEFRQKSEIPRHSAPRNDIDYGFFSSLKYFFNHPSTRHPRNARLAQDDYICFAI
jgi:hypothetical protein